MGSNSRMVSVRPVSDEERTIFILGGGSSIDTLSEGQWHHIGQSTSVGLNYWSVHTFRPDFLAVEIGGYFSENNPRIRIPTPMEVALETDTPRRRSKILFHGPVDIASRVALSAARKKGIPVRFYPSLPLRVGTPVEIGKDIRNIFRVNPAAWTGLPWAIDGWSSISRIVSMALMNGWSNVVLVGVDLEGPYFERHQLFMKKYEHFEREGFHLVPAGYPHKTNEHERRGLRLIEFLPQMDVQARKIGLGRIMIGSGSGPLNGVLESYNW